MSIFDIDAKTEGITQDFLINNGWVPSEIDIIENRIVTADKNIIWVKRVVEDNKHDYKSCTFYTYEKTWWLGYDFNKKILYNLDNGVKFEDIKNILDLETLIYSIKTNKISYE